MHLTDNGEKGPKLWDYARKHKLIGLDRSDMNHNWNDFTDAEKKAYYWNISITWHRQFQAFCNKMEKDDVVVVLEGQHSVLGVGRVEKGERETHRYQPDLKPNVFLTIFEISPNGISNEIIMMKKNLPSECRNLGVLCKTRLRVANTGKH